MCLLARLTSFPSAHYYYAKTLDGDWLVVKLLCIFSTLDSRSLHSGATFKAILKLVQRSESAS